MTGHIIHVLFHLSFIFAYNMDQHSEIKYEYSIKKKLVDTAMIPFVIVGSYNKSTKNNIKFYKKFAGMFQMLCIAIMCVLSFFNVLYSVDINSAVYNARGFVELIMISTFHWNLTGENMDVLSSIINDLLTHTKYQFENECNIAVRWYAKYGLKLQYIMHALAIIVVIIGQYVSIAVKGFPTNWTSSIFLPVWCPICEGTLWNTIISVILAIGTFSLAGSVIGKSGIAGAITVIISGEFQTLHSNLKEIVTEDKKIGECCRSEIQRQKIIACIKKHHMLLKLWSKIQLYYKWLLVPHMYGIMLVLAMTYYTLRMSKKLSYIAIDVTFVCVLFLYLLPECYIGSLVRELNENICFSIYQTEWLLCNVKLRKMLVTIMCYSHRPLVLGTQFVPEASIALYGNILKASFSYFNVLRELKKKQ